MDSGVKFGLGGSINNQLAAEAPDYASFQPGKRTTPDMLENMFQQDLAARRAPTGMGDVWQAIRKAREEEMDVQSAVSLIGSVARRLPPDQFRRMPQVIQGGTLDDVWAFQQKHPDLKDLLTLPEFHQVFGDKLKPLSAAAKFYYSLPPVSAYLGAKRGWMNMESRKTFQHAFAGKRLDDPEFLAERRKFERERQALQDLLENIDFQLPKPLALMNEFGVNAGDMVGGMAAGATTAEGLAGIVIGGTLGALAGGWGAIPGAAAGGGLFGSTTAMAEAEAGETLWEIWESQPEEQKDENLARLGGLLSFGTTVGLEYIGAKALVTPGLGRGLSRGFVSSLGKLSPRVASSAERVLAGRGGQMIGSMAGHMAPEILTETLQEGSQTATQILAGRMYNDRYGAQGFTAMEPTWGDVASAMGQAAWQTFWGGAAIGAVHPIIEAWSGQGDPVMTDELTRRTVEAAEKSVRLEMVDRGNLDLRRNVKGLTETLRGMVGPETPPDAAQAVLERLGENRAYISPKVLETYFQGGQEQEGQGRPAGVDPETVTTDFLAHLGVTAEQYFEALDNGTDLEVDLTGLPHVVDNPMWDQVAEHLTVEPLAVTEEMRADLEAMGPPLDILPKANANVRPEVRADLEQRMITAGRTREQARRDAEFATRMAGIRARIMGTDANTELGRVDFARAGVVEGMPLYQPSVEEVRAADKALAEDVAAWEKAVDAYPDKLDPYHQITMLRQTPLVLQMIGAKNLRMIVNFGKMKEILV